MHGHEVKELAETVESAESIPRRTVVQRHRNNVDADTELEYYKRSLAIPMVDDLLQHLKDRFSADECWPVSALLQLVPKVIVKQTNIPISLAEFIKSPGKKSYISDCTHFSH